MRQFWKFTLIAGGAFLALLVILMAAAAIIIHVKYPPAVLKKMATDKLSETLKRDVTIGDVRFNVLSGFEINQLTVSNRPGWAPGKFLSADEISISYHLFPLLWGQISLGQVELKNFQVLVERRSASEFNFSDMTGSSTAPAAPEPAVPTQKKKKTAKHKRAQVPGELPETAMSTGSFFAESAWAGETSTAAPSKTGLLLSVDSVKIEHGKLVYLDETTSPTQKSDLQDLNLTVKNISMVGGKTVFELDAPFSYNKTAYHMVVGGSFRYFLADQTLKELEVKGKVNDLAFGLQGDVQDMTGNTTPNLDGTASLDMLKFSGLVPASLSKMPEGLSLTGPAEVDFHLGGSAQKGLELSGTADASKLALAYKDLFVKTASTTCKVDFKTINQLNRGIYDVPSLKVSYDNWEVTGAFHYRADGSYSGEIHSQALPFGGLPAMIPKLKRATFDGTGSVNLSVSETGGKAASFSVNGQILLKDVGITLPQEPYLQNMTGPINFTGNVVRVPGIRFNSFDGAGEAGVTYTFNSQAYGYALVLKNVNIQKAIDASIDAYVTTKDYSSYKDKFYGNLNLSYAGTGKGLSGDEMITNLKGAGNYALTKSKVQDLAAVTAINKFMKSSSNEIDFDQITGNLAMKNKVFSYTANTEGKVGAVRETGGIDCVTMAYSPDMKVQCDLKEQYLNSDAVDAALPDLLKGQAKNLDWFADDKGNIPVDFTFTGKAADNHYSYDWARIKKNIGKHLGSAAVDAGKNLIKNLFGQ